MKYLIPHLLLFLLLTGSILTVNAQSQNIQGTWYFLSLELEEIEPNSGVLLNKTTITSVNELTSKNILNGVPVKMDINTPLTIVQQGEILEYRGASQFIIQTSGTTEIYGYFVEGSNIHLFVDINAFKGITVENWVQANSYNFEINGSILSLSYSFYANNEQGKTMLYQFNCNFKPGN